MGRGISLSYLFAGARRLARFKRDAALLCALGVLSNVELHAWK